MLSIYQVDFRSIGLQASNLDALSSRRLPASSVAFQLWLSPGLARARAQLGPWPGSGRDALLRAQAWLASRRGSIPDPARAQDRLGPRPRLSLSLPLAWAEAQRGPRPSQDPETFSPQAISQKQDPETEWLGVVLPGWVCCWQMFQQASFQLRHLRGKLQAATGTEATHSRQAHACQTGLPEENFPSSNRLPRALRVRQEVLGVIGPKTNRFSHRQPASWLIIRAGGPSSSGAVYSTPCQ